MYLPWNANQAAVRHEYVNKEIEREQSKAAPGPQNRLGYIPRPFTVAPLKPGYPRTSDGKVHELDNSSLVYNRLYPEERKFGDFIFGSD